MYESIYKYCRNNNVSKIAEILDENSDIINNNNAHNETLLTIACRNNFIDMVKLLLEYPKLDVNKSNNRYTPLYYVCIINSFEIAKLLINDDRIDVNKLDEYWHETPLHGACYGNHLNITKLLLEHPNIDVNKKDGSGRTPLLLTTRRRVLCDTITELLKDHRTNVEIRCNIGCTVLENLCNMGPDENTNNFRHNNIVQQLIENNSIEINAGNGSPFLFACYRENVYVINLFLDDNRTNVNQKFSNNVTAFHDMCHCGFTNIVKILLNNDRIDVNLPNKDQLTPFHIACLKGRCEIVQLLMQSDRIIITDIDECNMSKVKDYEIIWDQSIFDLIKNDTENLAKILLSANHENTIYNAIESKNFDKFFQIMSDTDFDINNKDRNWCHPLSCAYHNDIVMFETILKDPRIDINDVIKKTYMLYDSVASERADRVEYLKLMLNHPNIDINNIQTNNGNTIMHYLCDSKNCYDFIINYPGINLNSIDVNGCTPFYTACNKGNIVMIEKLLQIDSVDPNIANNKGFTPFHIACLCLHIDIVKLLLSNEKVIITTFPENIDSKEYRIFEDDFDDNKYDELIKLLSEDDRIECQQILDKIQCHLY